MVGSIHPWFPKGGSIHNHRISGNRYVPNFVVPENVGRVSSELRAPRVVKDAHATFDGLFVGLDQFDLDGLEIWNHTFEVLV